MEQGAWLLLTTTECKHWHAKNHGRKPKSTQAYFIDSRPALIPVRANLVCSGMSLIKNIVRLIDRRPGFHHRRHVIPISLPRQFALPGIDLLHRGQQR